MQEGLSEKLLRELLKDSKRSDRELAKILDVSQPTLTRNRRKLEESGMIRGYTIVPNFRKMGFEILALTFVKTLPGVQTKEVLEKAREYAAEFPNAILSSSGEGLGMNGVVISFHRNFTDYHRHLNRMRSDWKDFLEDVQSFIISLEEGEFKKFSLTYLSEASL